MCKLCLPSLGLHPCLLVLWGPQTQPAQLVIWVRRMGLTEHHSEHFLTYISYVMYFCVLGICSMFCIYIYMYNIIASNLVVMTEIWWSYLSIYWI